MTVFSIVFLTLWGIFQPLSKGIVANFSSTSVAAQLISTHPSSSISILSFIFSFFFYFSFSVVIFSYLLTRGDREKNQTEAQFPITHSMSPSSSFSHKLQKSPWLAPAPPIYTGGTSFYVQTPVVDCFEKRIIKIMEIWLLSRTHIWLIYLIRTREIGEEA